MLESTEMARGEAVALLARGTYGHLGCARDGHPYVVPMNYAFDGECLYFYTTEGTKTELIAANREVCLRVEEMDDPSRWRSVSSRWRSVVVMGRAERLSASEDVERAVQLITARNPTLEPAVSRTKIGAWTRRGVAAVFRIRPEAVCGREIG